VWICELRTRPLWSSKNAFESKLDTTEDRETGTDGIVSMEAVAIVRDIPNSLWQGTMSDIGASWMFSGRARDIHDVFGGADVLNWLGAGYY